ncbi:unnamed protein product [Prunus armeniaca]|uniref:Uncharacterized protein n=1 Tax=Prunus armeniaca TaxID=36596 RepID=A0A6J5VC41_PRUAR|nr:unnamed protein product [Prunus armeniaca]
MPHRQHDHRATARDVTFPAITRGQRPPRPRSHADASHWKPAPSGGKFSIATTIQESMTSARLLTTQPLLSESTRKFGGHGQARLRTILVSFCDTNHTIGFFSAGIANAGTSPLRRCRRAADERTIVPPELPSSENAIPLASRNTATSTGSSRLGPASFMEF